MNDPTPEQTEAAVEAWIAKILGKGHDDLATIRTIAEDIAEKPAWERTLLIRPLWESMGANLKELEDNPFSYFATSRPAFADYLAELKEVRSELRELFH